MKTIITRLELLEGLKKVANTFSIKTTVPVLAFVKIETSKNGISLTTCNIDSLSIVEIETIENTTNGSILVPFKLLSDFIKKSKADTITIEQIDNMQVSIKAANIDYKLMSDTTDQFPILPNFKGDFITVNTNDYKRAINNTAPMVAKTESRPVLQGVHIELNNNILKFIGTDSHRMGRYLVDNIDSFENYNHVLDGKVLEKTVKMLDKKNETIQIGYDESSLYSVLKFDNVTLYIRKIEGNYPDTSRLFPDNFKTETTVKAKEMIESLSMLQTIAKEDRNNVVRMELNGKVELSTNSPEIGKMEALLDAKKDGEDLKISFSATFASDALKALNDTTVKMQFKGSNYPFIINSTDNKITHLILPVRTY